jgi:hypothetical protein
MDRDVANAKAMKLAQSDTSFAEAPRVRRWAKAIGCSTGLVSALPFWKACQKKIGKVNAAKKPKVVALTDVVAATVGQLDPELERLISEQQADSEPSPLDPVRRRPRSRRPSV